MGGPANILDPVRRRKDWMSVASPMSKEALEKQVRIDGMRFTLDDFDRLCSGKFNAGSLTLDATGRLGIVNNHCGLLFFLNNSAHVEVAADAFAIRQAFAKALEDAGLGEERMSEVRNRLGLRKDNNTYGGAACFSPLKRQEVREIMDRYIDELNANRGDGEQLRTHAQQRAARGFSAEQTKSFDRIRNSFNGENYGNVTLKFDEDMLHALDFMSKNDYKDFEDEKLHRMAVFFEDFEDRITELAHTTDEDLQIWRHENPGEERFLPVSATLSVGQDRRTKNVLFRVQGVGEQKVVVFSSGMTPAKMLARIRASNERLHAEGAKRGLNLAGKEFVDGKNVDGNSIKERPKTGRKNKTGIIEEPKGEVKIDRKNAQKNLNTLATLIARQLQVDSDSVAAIIKKVEGWEDKLSKCSTAGNPDTIDDINDDLRNFLFENRATIEPLLKEVPIAMGEKYDS